MGGSKAHWCRFQHEARHCVIGLHRTISERSTKTFGPAFGGRQYAVAKLARRLALQKGDQPGVEINSRRVRAPAFVFASTSLQGKSNEQPQKAILLPVDSVNENPESGQESGSILESDEPNTQPPTAMGISHPVARNACGLYLGEVHI